jgi:hypothetical protein
MLVSFGIVCRITYELYDFIFVTKVDKNNTPMVSSAGNPATDSYFLPNMFFIDFCTIVCSHVRSSRVKFDAIIANFY